MSAYDRYLAGELVDFEYPAEAIEAAMQRLPKVDPKLGG
jgi:tryptophan synthase beta chain